MKIAAITTTIHNLTFEKSSEIKIKTNQIFIMYTVFHYKIKREKVKKNVLRISNAIMYTLLIADHFYHRHHQYTSFIL